MGNWILGMELGSSRNPIHFNAALHIDEIDVEFQELARLTDISI